MGAGIAQVVAASGRPVSLHDAQPGAAERGLEAMRGSLAKLAAKGGPDPDEVLARVEPVYAEYNVGHYARAFTLSDKIDQDGISAELADGVLTLTLKKAKSALPRRIAIR